MENQMGVASDKGYIGVVSFCCPQLVSAWALRMLIQGEARVTIDLTLHQNLK